MNRKQIAKRIALTIAWFLLVLFVVTILMGCATNKEHPMYDNLLFEKAHKNLAYKSITIHLVRKPLIPFYAPTYDNPLVVVETTEVNSREHLDELYGEYVEQGYEGQMIRLDGPYENKRSPRLLKRKEFVDEEYTILGYEEGEGNRTGTLKHLKFKNKNGRDFKSNVKGSFEYLTKLFKTADTLIGKDATIKYFNLTPDGVPRFPYVIAIRDYE